MAFDSPAREPLALLVLGEIVNAITSNAAKQRHWKVHVTQAVKEARGAGHWIPGDEYAISLAFRFHPGFHGGPNRSLDVENFMKPVLDGVAVGVFCDPNILPDSIPRWDYDDSNFSTLFVHRLPNTPDSGDEGVAPFNLLQGFGDLAGLLKMVLVRKALIDDAAGIARVRAESWQSAYRGIVPDEFLDGIDVGEWSEWQRGKVAVKSDDMVYLVALAEGQAVGFAEAGPNREDDPDCAGELYAIYLLPEYQGRGIGLKLTAATARWLMGVGMDSMILWVLSENDPARRFYEALGGRYVRHRKVQIGGVWLPEVSYGWRELGPLTGGGSPPGQPG